MSVTDINDNFKEQRTSSQQQTLADKERFDVIPKFGQTVRTKGCSLLSLQSPIQFEFPTIVQ